MSRPASTSGIKERKRERLMKGLFSDNSKLLHQLIKKEWARFSEFRTGGGYFPRNYRSTHLMISIPLLPASHCACQGSRKRSNSRPAKKK
jgi:hypothetical protein